MLGQLFVQSVQQALSPQLSALFARGETRAANSVFQAATLWSMIAAWPLYLVMAGFAPDAAGRLRRGVRRRLRRGGHPVADHAAGHGVRARRLRAAHGRPQLAEPAQQHRGARRQRRPERGADPAATGSAAPRSPGPSPSWCATCCRSSRSAATSRCGRSPVRPCRWALGAVACFGIVDIVAVAAGLPSGRRWRHCSPWASWATCPASGPGARRSDSGRSARRCAAVRSLRHLELAAEV